MRLNQRQRNFLSTLITIMVVFFLGWLAYTGLSHNKDEHYRSTSQSPPPVR